MCSRAATRRAGKHVGGFDGASRYVDFAVSVSSAGSYPLTFQYSSGEVGGYIDYAINGGGGAQRYQRYRGLEYVCCQ